MFYLSNFARPKGAKDKKPRKRNSLGENLAIVSIPTFYSNYLFGQALQIAEKNSINKNLKKTHRNINEKLEWSKNREKDYNFLKNKKSRTPNQQYKFDKLKGYKNQTGDLFLSGRELTGLENNKKLLPKLEKKWNKVKNIPTPENIKDALIPKLKYLTPTRLGITVLGGAGATALTGATLKRIREMKEKN